MMGSTPQYVDPMMGGGHAMGTPLMALSTPNSRLVVPPRAEDVADATLVISDADVAEVKRVLNFRCGDRGYETRAGREQPRNDWRGWMTSGSKGELPDAVHAVLKANADKVASTTQDYANQVAASLVHEAQRRDAAFFRTSNVYVETMPRASDAAPPLKGARTCQLRQRKNVLLDAQLNCSLKGVLELRLRNNLAGPAPWHEIEIKTWVAYEHLRNFLPDAINYLRTKTPLPAPPTFACDFARDVERMAPSELSQLENRLKAARDTLRPGGHMPASEEGESVGAIDALLTLGAAAGQMGGAGAGSLSPRHAAQAAPGGAQPPPMLGLQRPAVSALGASPGSASSHSASSARDTPPAGVRSPQVGSPGARWSGNKRALEAETPICDGDSASWLRLTSPRQAAAPADAPPACSPADVPMADGGAARPAGACAGSPSAPHAEGVHVEGMPDAPLLARLLSAGQTQLLAAAPTLRATLGNLHRLLGKMAADGLIGAPADAPVDASAAARAASPAGASIDGPVDAPAVAPPRAAQPCRERMV